MEQYRRAATGRLAEILGLDYLGQDVLARTTGYSAAELEQQFESLAGEAKTIVTGYLDGVNRRIAEVVADPGPLPFEFKAIGAQLGQPFVPEPWTASDILAWVALMQRNFDPEALEMGQVENGVLLQSLAAAYPTDYQTMFSDLRWINDPAAQTMIPRTAPKQARTLRAPEPAAFPDLAVAARTPEPFRRPDQKLERINARSRWAATRGWCPATRRCRAIRPSTPARRWASRCRRSCSRARSAAAASRSRG
jgi:penicillin amidase